MLNGYQESHHPYGARTGTPIMDILALDLQRKPGGGDMARKKKTPENNLVGKARSKEISNTISEQEKYSKEERKLIEKYVERLKREPLESNSLTSLDNTKQINTGADKLLTLAKMTEATGSPSYGVQMLFFDQVVSTFRGVHSSEGFGDDETLIKTFDNVLALLNGINPQDEIEGMLAVQMVGVSSWYFNVFS